MKLLRLAAVCAAVLTACARPVPADTTPPGVLSTSPHNGGTGFEPDATLTVTFSEAMDAATLDAMHVLVKRGQAPVAGAVAASGAAATFTPASPLALGVLYTAVVSAGVKDLAGNPLAADHIWTFTVREGAWTTPVPIEGLVKRGHTVSLAADGAGNVIAVGVQAPAGQPQNVWANRYVPGQGWDQHAVVIGSLNDPAFAPYVAANLAGVAFAFFSFVAGGIDRSWAARYTPQGLWEATQRIDTDVSRSCCARGVVDAHGNATVIFSEQVEGPYHVAWNRYAAGQGWGTAAMFEDPDAYRGGIAVHAASGQAFAAHWQSDGQIQHAYVRRYVPGTGWEPAVRVSDGLGDAVSPELAVDGLGNALVTFHEWEDIDRASVWSNRFVAGTGWSTPVKIETSDEDASSPMVAADGDGNAIAVWHQYDGERINLWAARYAIGEGWGAARLIEERDGDVNAVYSIAMSPAGDASVVWNQDGVSACASCSKTSSIVSNRYTAGIGWATAREVVTFDPQYDSGLALAIDPQGRATAAWVFCDDVQCRALAARFE
jgi:hypothetical protein